MTQFIKLTTVIGQEEGEDDLMVETTTPVYISKAPGVVRSFHARKPIDGVVPPGTRIEYPNSAAVIVTESVDEVLAALDAA